jgi:hypothetical protein
MKKINAFFKKIFTESELLSKQPLTLTPIMFLILGITFLLFVEDSKLVTIVWLSSSLFFILTKLYSRFLYKQKLFKKLFPTSFDDLY